MLLKKITIQNLSAYGLEGGVFGVYANAGCTQKVGDLTTDANGNTNTLQLPCNTNGSHTYYIREDAAPAGHLKNDDVQSFTVNLPADAGKTIEKTFNNNPQTDNVPGAFVQKLNSKGKPVSGVIFKVRLYDGVYNSADACPAGQLKKTWYLKSDIYGNVNFGLDYLAPGYQSDGFYIVNNQVVIPIGCTVTFQEVKTPAQYVLDDSINLWQKNGQVIDVKKFYNFLAPCKINIKKYSADGRTPLQGVSFELKFVKESEAYTADALKTYAPLLKQGETKTLTTDANGNISFENLDQGEYQITEIKTTDGNTLLKEPINITLPITMTDKEAKALSAATDNGKFDEYTNKWYFYESTYEITNNATFTMPRIGGNGYWVFGLIGFGAAAVAVFGIVMYDKKKKKQHKKK